MEYYVKCAECGKSFILRLDADEDLVDSIRSWIRCPGCEHAEAERKKAEAVERALAERKENFETLLEWSNLKRYALDYSAGHPGANKELFDWVSVNRHESIYLAGKTGLCKTRILQYWARKAVLGGLNVIYWNCKDLLDMLCSTDNAKRIDKLLEPLYRCDLLILDELGKENATAAKVKNLYGLIEKRYTGWDQKVHGRMGRVYGGQLWVTTNVDAEGLARIFGEDFPPVLRRIREMCAIWEKF